MLRGLVRKAGDIASRSNGSSRVVVLIFHRILPSPDLLRTGDKTSDEFEKQIKVISTYFTPLTFGEAISRLSANNVPDRAVVVTFDDGYRDNYQLAFPILRKYGVPATFFVSTGFLDGTMMWNDTVIEAIRSAIGSRIDLNAIGLGSPEISNASDAEMLVGRIVELAKHKVPEERDAVVELVSGSTNYREAGRLMMNEKEVLELHNSGMEIGAHTVSHPILTKLTENRAEMEIRQSKETLERLIGTTVKSFAYPNGRFQKDYATEHVEIVKRSGFKGAATTEWGAASTKCNVFEIPRQGLWANSEIKLLFQLLRNFRQTAN